MVCEFLWLVRYSLWLGIVCFVKVADLSFCSMRLLPKSPSDRVAFIFALLMIHVVGFFELLVVLPYIDASGYRTYWVHVVIGIFLYFSVMSSYYKLFTVDSTTSSTILPTLKPPGWSYCSECCSTAPRRCRHCWICNVCVLKRDHHCIFTGNCVGHRNQRYFLTLLVYLAISSTYCNYLNMDYTLEVLGGQLTAKAVLTMFLPMLSWTLGLAGAYTFAVSFISAICIVGFLLFTVLLIYHGRNVFHGQTCFEATNGIREFDLGVRRNLRQIFGNRWHVAWISPFISSPLPGNGVEFSTLYENIKDMWLPLMLCDWLVLLWFLSYQPHGHIRVFSSHLPFWLAYLGPLEVCNSGLISLHWL